MKEIFDVIGTRIKSPVFGYSVFAFIAVNWKSIFYMFISDDKVSDRFAYFDSNTSLQTLIFIPVIFAVVMAIIYPWINYLFLFVGRVPTDLRNSLQAQSEHTLLVKKQALEKLRSSLLSNKENELIERAKRDQKLSEIENTHVREKLQKELESLRAKMDNLGNGVKANPNDEMQQIANLIDLYKQRADTAESQGNLIESKTFWDKALTLQEKLAFRSKELKGFVA